MLKGKFFHISKKFFNKYGYDLVSNQKKDFKDNKAEAHPGYLENAATLNLDVNDYQESQLGFVESLPLLKQIVFPLIDKFENPRLLELGPGTGRWSRHINKKIEEKGKGELHLVDHSQWIVEFLKNYFKNNLKIEVHQCDGFVLPANFKDSSIDIIFSSNTFVGLGIYFYFTYSKDFFRVLKKGGYCVFDFIDLNSKGGWDFLIQKINEGLNYYMYYTFDAVDKVFHNAGFEYVDKYCYGKSTYLIYKKPQ